METSQSLAGTRALICEDEGFMSLVIERILRAEGAEVIGIAENGEEGVRLALEKRPDVVLMDLHMPVLDGVEATRLICSAYPARVVMLSGISDETALESARVAGAAGWIPKPVSRQQLISVLIHILANGQTDAWGRA